MKNSLSLWSCICPKTSPLLSIIKPQLLRDIIFSKVSLLSLFLSLLITKAPKLKNHLLGAEVAGIYKYFRIIVAKVGYLSLWLAHHSSSRVYNILLVFNKFFFLDF
jgi:hypothetical protein